MSQDLRLKGTSSDIDLGDMGDMLMEISLCFYPY